MRGGEGVVSPFHGLPLSDQELEKRIRKVWLTSRHDVMRMSIEKNMKEHIAGGSFNRLGNISVAHVIRYYLFGLACSMLRVSDSDHYRLGTVTKKLALKITQEIELDSRIKLKLAEIAKRDGTTNPA